jgi:hypothetical protein
MSFTIKDETPGTLSPKTERRFDIHDGLFVVGFILLESGVAKLSFAAALILAGLICLLPFLIAGTGSLKRALRSKT